MVKDNIHTLEAKVENLTQKHLKNHAVKNEPMTLLFLQLSGSPSGTST